MKTILGKIFGRKQSSLVPAYNRALDWVRQNTIPEQGIIVNSKQPVPYLEVTGYFIPTLLDAGERNLAEQYAEFLSYMQRPIGAFAGTDGAEYIFDTGQALRGLVRACRYWDRFRIPTAKAADYILSSIQPNGRIPANYNGQIPEYVHLFLLPALMETGAVLERPDYIEAAQKSLRYYKNCPDVLDANVLTHFLSYIIDGFIDMGESAFVKPFVDAFFKSQKKNGSITAYPNVNWVCSTGLAQLAIIGYKMDKSAEADKAIDYLCTLQNSTGGFYGSYGFKPQYFHKQEISWANKFFIDAVHLKISSFFDSNASMFPTDIIPEDGRLSAVVSHLGPFEHKRILDAGCGKGRFAAKIKEMSPSCEMHGVDISKELLNTVPSNIVTKEGSILNLPYDSGYFDGVFCIEALEHAVRTEKAMEELCRVVKDGGRIIIIDKNIEKLGRMKITSFEQWFDKDLIKEILSIHCSDIHVREISYHTHKADGLFFAWSGTKNDGNLNAVEWNKVIVGNNNKAISGRIKSNRFPQWSKPIIEHTLPGDSILELGSGTGEISAVLGIYGRLPHLLDYSADSIRSAQELFKEIGINAKFYCADILTAFPMESQSVDWVWSSGVLEHFSDEHLQFIMKESVRVCRKGVMSLVPNARAIFYRIGKFKMEQEGSWSYGKEIPKFTMKNYFEKVGLQNIKEYSVGAYHALQFWGLDKKEIKSFYDSLSLEELQSLNQGYLLFTYGEKLKPNA